MKNIYELANNRQNDIFRYAWKFTWYVVVFALGYFYCHYTITFRPIDVTCHSAYKIYPTVQWKQVLPNTWADVSH